MSTFVSVGNATQPFDRLLLAVRDVAHHLPQPVFVQFGASALRHWSDCIGADYVGMAEFEKRVQESELLIVHAGAGSLIHAIRARKVPVVMPRRAHLGEHVDDHQLEFASELARTEKIVIATDSASIIHAAAVALERQRQEADWVRQAPPIVERVLRVLRAQQNS